MKLRALLICGFLTLIAVGGWLYWEWTKSPEYSLYQAHRAFRNHDLAEFNRYVDTQTFINSAVDTTFDVLAERLASSTNPNNKPFDSLALEVMSEMKPLAINAAHEELLMIVAGGGPSSEHFGPNTFPNNLHVQSSFKTLLEHALRGLKKEYRRIEGKDAFIALHITMLDHGPPEILEFRLRTLGDHWRLVEVSNLREIISKRTDGMTPFGPDAPGHLSAEKWSAFSSTGRRLYAEWSAHPAYSLLQIQRAVETRDLRLFEHHVDVNSLTTRAVDVFIEIVLEAVAKSDDPSEVFGGVILAGLIKMMKPTLVSHARARILMQIEGRPAPPINQNASAIELGLEKALDGMISNADGRIEKISIQKQGQIAFLVLDIRDQARDRNRQWNVKLREMGGYWQVIEIANLKSLMEHP